jgi:hypothetical protein
MVVFATSNTRAIGRVSSAFIWCLTRHLTMHAVALPAGQTPNARDRLVLFGV